MNPSISKDYVRYSQNDEQDIIDQYFNYSNYGVFLDIGANDGVTLSNTYALQKRGWEGVYVEASPKAYQRLLKNIPPRYNVTMHEVAVGKENKDIVFYESGELLGQGDTSLVSSSFLEETHRWKSLRMPFEKIVVPMVDFQGLLQMSHRHKKFDLLSLDIEGGEKDVVPQIDFAALGIKMAVLEFNGKDEDYFSSYMTPFGFKLIHKNAENLIYAL